MATNQPVAGGLSNGGLQVSLPKLQLQTFDGNLQQWREIFDAAVHQQQGLPPVAKFSYLKSILKGTAGCQLQWQFLGYLLIMITMMLLLDC